MSITLDVRDPKQVSSPSSFEVLIGEPARQLLILSGIAIPEFWTNHDEEVKRDDIVVRLGIFVASVERATVHVGLASIANDETNFLFALDTAAVAADSGSGELTLHVNAALLGEKTLIHRFGYQVVAHVHRVFARIAGSIYLPHDVLNVEGWSVADVHAMFEITANRVEMVGQPGQFAFEKLIPVATAGMEEVRTIGAGSFVDYSIDGCPMNTPLIVHVKLTGRLASVGVAVGQTAGGRPVLLSTSEPDASGVDFGVGRVRGPN